MSRTPSRRLVPAVLLAAALALGGCAGADPTPSGSSPHAGAVAAAESLASAADSAPAGYLGGGLVLRVENDTVSVVSPEDVDVPVVTEWFDLHCPYCAQFQADAGEVLAERFETGEIALDLHPMAFLDSHSDDDFSTRGAVLLAALADSEQPAAWYGTMVGLLAAQPENGTGMSDENMLRIATEAGADTEATLASAPEVTVSQALASRSFEAWIHDQTEATFAAGLEQVPTVAVDGAFVHGFDRASVETALDAL